MVTIFIFVIVVALVVITILISKQHDKKLKIDLESAKNKLEELNKSDKFIKADYEYIYEFVNSTKFHINKFNEYLDNAINNRVKYNNLVEKYGQDVAVKIYNNEYWIGMTQEQLQDVKGRPTKIETEILKTKTKEVWIYGNKSSGDYFVFENGCATKIVDR